MDEAPKRGRPTEYTPALAAEICERLAAGREGLRRICEDAHMPSETTVRRWAIEDREGFSSQYEAARNLGLDAMADEVLGIADGRDGEDPQRDRLRFDARRWYLSKLAPKRYGDKLQHTGPDGDGPVKMDHAVEIHIVDHRADKG